MAKLLRSCWYIIIVLVTIFLLATSCIGQKAEIEPSEPPPNATGSEIEPSETPTPATSLPSPTITPTPSATPSKTSTPNITPPPQSSPSVTPSNQPPPSIKPSAQPSPSVSPSPSPAASPTPKAAPAPSGVVPTSGQMGTTLPVTINGLNFTGTTASGVSFGAGVTVNSFTVNSDSQIAASIAIASTAAAGYRNVSVTTAAGTGTLNNAFNIYAPSSGGGGGGGGSVTRPTVSSVSPFSGALGVAIDTPVTATFSKAMNVSSISTTTFTLTQGETSVPGSVTYLNKVATFTPSAPLAYNTMYTATITSGVMDTSGYHLASDYTWDFTTIAQSDTTPPTVSSVNPTNGAAGVPINIHITATFSEAMKASTINAQTFGLTQNGTKVPGSATYNGANNTATFTPSASLAGNTLYTADINTAVTDLAGNHLASDYTWEFTTGSQSDTTPPTVVSVSPADGTAGVAIDTPVTATFSEAMKASIVPLAFSVTRGGQEIPGNVTYNNANYTATFIPSSSLAYNNSYTATISTDAIDESGNHLANDYIWHFTTAGPSDTTPPTVISVSPVHGATGVAISTSITATFSEAMNTSTISTATFSLSPAPATGVSVTWDSGNRVTFTPNNFLAYGKTYTASISTGVTDLVGNHLASPYTWSFTTVQPPPTVTVSIDAPASVAAGSDFVATVNVTQVTNLAGYDFKITYNPAVIQIITPLPGGAGGTLYITPGSIDSTDLPLTPPGFDPPGVQGRTRIFGYLVPPNSVSGSGYLCQIHFHVSGASGQSNITLSDVTLADSNSITIPSNLTNATVSVSG